MTHTDLAIQFNTLIDQINDQTSYVNHLNWTKSGKHHFEPIKKISIPKAHEILDTDLLSRLLTELNTAMSILKELHEQKNGLEQASENMMHIENELFETSNQIRQLVFEVNLSIHSPTPK